MFYMMAKKKYSCPFCSYFPLIKKPDIFQYFGIGRLDRKKKRTLHVCSSCSFETFTPNYPVPFFVPGVADDFVVAERLLDPAELLDGSFCQLYDAYFVNIRHPVTDDVKHQVRQSVKRNVGQPFRQNLRQPFRQGLRQQV
jgi:hypothetical protein